MSRNNNSSKYTIMKMKKGLLMYQFGLTLCFCGILFSWGCTKDEFFRINDATCINMQTIHEIATSELYVDYQKARYSFINSICNVDSTKIGHIQIIDGDTIFEGGCTISYSLMYELHDSLVKKYPELIGADQADLILIEEIALSNNYALKEIATKSAVSPLFKTRANSYGDTALQWCENNASNAGGPLWISRTKIEGWLFPTEEGGYEPAPNNLIYQCVYCTSIDHAMEQACIWSVSSGEKEVGGLGWNDNSGVMIYCINGSAEGWTVFYPAWTKTPLPDMDFHVHPSGDLYPSTFDAQTWLHMPWIPHYIINYEHEMQIWQYE